MANSDIVHRMLRLIDDHEACRDTSSDVEQHMQALEKIDLREIHQSHNLTHRIGRCMVQRRRRTVRSRRGRGWGQASSPAPRLNSAGSLPVLVWGRPQTADPSHPLLALDGILANDFFPNLQTQAGGFGDGQETIFRDERVRGNFQSPGVFRQVVFNHGGIGWEAPMGFRQ